MWSIQFWLIIEIVCIFGLFLSSENSIENVIHGEYPAINVLYIWAFLYGDASTKDTSEQKIFGKMLWEEIE